MSTAEIFKVQPDVAKRATLPTGAVNYQVESLKPVYSYKDAQQLLGVSRSTFFGLLDQNVFDVVYLGERCRLVTGASVARFLESRTTKAAAQPGGKRVDNHA